MELKRGLFPFNPEKRKFLNKSLKFAGGLTAYALMARSGASPTLEQIRKEQEVPTLDQLLPKEFRPLDPNPFIVMLPGATGGGEKLTQLRNDLDEYYPNRNYVLSSLTTRESLKTGEDPKDHYQKAAADILSLSSNQDTIRIFGHSSGGNEMRLFLEELLPLIKDKNKKLELVFIAVPGLSEREDAAGALEFASRFLSMQSEYSYLEQHTAYPLPEDLQYLNIPLNNLPADLAKIPDSPIHRRERREKFALKRLPKIIGDTNKQVELLNQIAKVENDIRDNTGNNEYINQKIKERSELLQPVIDGLFEGKHISTDDHLFQLRKYHETETEIADSLTHAIHGLPVVLDAIAQDVFKGFDNSLKKVIDESQAFGIPLFYYIELLENDTIVQVDDLPRVLQSLQTAGIYDSLGGVFAVEAVAHSSLGYISWPLFLENIVFPNTGRSANSSIQMAV